MNMLFRRFAQILQQNLQRGIDDVLCMQWPRITKQLKISICSCIPINPTSLEFGAIYICVLQIIHDNSKDLVKGVSNEYAIVIKVMCHAFDNSYETIKLHQHFKSRTTMKQHPTTRRIAEGMKNTLCNKIASTCR